MTHAELITQSLKTGLTQVAKWEPRLAQQLAARCTDSDTNGRFHDFWGDVCGTPWRVSLEGVTQ